MALPPSAFRPPPASPPRGKQRVTLCKPSDSAIKLDSVQMCFFKSKMWANVASKDFSPFTLNYIEFIVFTCRLASTLFERVDPKRRSGYLVEIKNKPFAAKVAVMLNVLLPRLLIGYENASDIPLLAEMMASLTVL